MRDGTIFTMVEGRKISEDGHWCPVYDLWCLTGRREDCSQAGRCLRELPKKGKR